MKGRQPDRPKNHKYIFHNSFGYLHYKGKASSLTYTSLQAMTQII